MLKQIINNFISNRNHGNFQYQNNPNCNHRNNNDRYNDRYGNYYNNRYQDNNDQYYNNSYNQNDNSGRGNQQKNVPRLSGSSFQNSQQNTTPKSESNVRTIDSNKTPENQETIQIRMLKSDKPVLAPFIVCPQGDTTNPGCLEVLILIILFKILITLFYSQLNILKIFIILVIMHTSS